MFSLGLITFLSQSDQVGLVPDCLPGEFLDLFSGGHIQLQV